MQKLLPIESGLTLAQTLTQQGETTTLCSGLIQMDTSMRGYRLSLV